MTNGRETSENARERLARNVRAHRRAQGLTQKQLGQRAHCDRRYVSAIERQTRNAELDNIEELAVALGIDIHDLFALKRVDGR